MWHLSGANQRVRGQDKTCDRQKFSNSEIFRRTGIDLLQDQREVILGRSLLHKVQKVRGFSWKVHLVTHVNLLKYRRIKQVLLG